MWNAMFKEETITDASFTSPVVTLRDRLNIHGLEYKVTGDGTVDMAMETSISGEVWINNGKIAEKLSKLSGPGANGSDLLPLIIKPGDLIRFVATATNTVVLSGWFTQK
jgi:hypothetical protein